ncbi:MAG: hypothetical protein KDD16_00640 [Mangrovimonas sp.]|nr:hypothetical protein [Mangrovimonas sp.]MCB0434725.1 hypothetical protein [Mangrovimonas sp.]
MKTIITILTCTVFTLISQAQDLEKIKASKDLFILIEKREKSAFTKGRSSSKSFTRKNSKEQEWETMYVLHPSNKSEKNLWLTYKQYLDFDHMDRGDETQVFYFNKSFIKKNKDIIITEKLIDKIGFQDFLKLISGKQIFVIDKDEIKDNKIKLKQVISYDLNYEAEE